MPTTLAAGTCNAGGWSGYVTQVGGTNPVSPYSDGTIADGMCYQYDKPIDVSKIMYTVENNDTVLEERALEARKQAAAVISHSLSQVAQDAGNSLGNVDVEIKELAQPGKEANFAETITVQRGSGKRRGN